MRVDFPDGQWAEIHSVGEMPRLVTVRLQDMLAETPDEPGRYVGIQVMSRLRDTLMAMVIKQWSYDFERTGETADDVYLLPQASYDKLKRETHEHWEAA